MQPFPHRALMRVRAGRRQHGPFQARPGERMCLLLQAVVVVVIWQNIFVLRCMQLAHFGNQFMHAALKTLFAWFPLDAAANRRLPPTQLPTSSICTCFGKFIAWSNNCCPNKFDSTFIRAPTKASRSTCLIVSQQTWLLSWAWADFLYSRAYAYLWL